MHRSRRRERPKVRIEPAIGSYHELYFERVADGVAYCQEIVPHVVPPVGSLSEGQQSLLAVWLHVPRHRESSSHGCYLYLSQAVHEALERVGQVPRTSGTISRVSLPETSVLVFGCDQLDSRCESRAAHTAKLGHRVSRLAQYGEALDEADAILR